MEDPGAVKQDVYRYYMYLKRTIHTHRSIEMCQCHIVLLMIQSGLGRRSRIPPDLLFPVALGLYATSSGGAAIQIQALHAN